MNLLILVVDDEPDVEALFRQQFRRDLRAGRFAMEFAQSAAAALQCIADAADRSLMLITALSPIIGYDTASAIGHDADRSGRTLREAALDSGAISPGGGLANMPGGEVAFAPIEGTTNGTVIADIMLSTTQAGTAFPPSALKRMLSQAGFGHPDFVPLPPRPQTLIVAEPA